MASTKMLLVTTLLHVCLTVVGSEVILEVTFKRYSVNNRDWNDNMCDYFTFGMGRCDLKFVFCLHGIEQPCKNITMTEWTDAQTIDFGQYMKGVANPIKRTLNKWKGGFEFNCSVYDVDFNNDDLVDTFHSVYTFKNSPGHDKSSATPEAVSLFGRRKINPTSFKMEAVAYCGPNYYGSDCSVTCTAKDSNEDGHYTCDPKTGDKICLPAFETPAENCKVVKDDCIGVDCKNGGKCVDAYKTYTCQCAPGYTGRHCEVNSDECASNPCVNGGKCTDGINSFTCACTGPFGGPTCSDHACTTNPCAHGKCYFSNDTKATACNCEAGFTGAKCDVKICAPGTSGPNCETITKCDPSLCKNGGVCKDNKCNCLPGYSGSVCETNIDDCGSQACVNNGTCVDQVNAFTCRCLPGFTGKTCQTQKNVTQSKPHVILQSVHSVVGFLQNMTQPIFRNSEKSTATQPRPVLVWTFLIIPLVVMLTLIIVIIVAAVRRKRNIRKLLMILWSLFLLTLVSTHLLKMYKSP